MNKYPITASIASREFQFGTDGAATVVRLVIGIPTELPEAPHQDWYCPWSIEGPHDTWEHHAEGVDALQALVLALSAIRGELEQVRRSGSLTWLGCDDLGLNIVG